METDDTTPSHQPRPRVRFSLRSLVLFVLLIGNVLVLDANRDYPWERIKERADCTKDYDPFSSTSRDISPRGGIVVNCEDGGLVSVNKIETNELLRRLTPPPGRTCSGVMFSPDGRRLITVHDAEKVILWDAETWDPLRTLQGKPLAARWEKGHGGLLVLNDGSVSSLIRGEHIASLEGAGNLPSHYVSFSSDGRLLLLVGRRAVQFYTTADWARAGELCIPGMVIHKAYFEPDDSIIVESREDVVYKTATPHALPPCSATRWRRIAPWGWDSTWYRPEIWIAIFLAPALLVSFWFDGRRLQRR